MEPMEVVGVVGEVLIQVTTDIRRVALDELACPLPLSATIKRIL